MIELYKKRIEKLKKTSNIFKTNRVVKGHLNKKFYF